MIFPSRGQRADRLDDTLNGTPTNEELIALCERTLRSSRMVQNTKQLYRP
jgi:hypothetical protein